MPPKKKGSKLAEDRMYCIYKNHGRKYSKDNFYQANPGSIWKNTPYGKIPICKECIKGMAINYHIKTNNPKLAIYKTCARLDIPFINGVYEGALDRAKGNISSIFGYYMVQFNAFSKNEWNDWDTYCFDDSDMVDFSQNELVKLRNIERQLNDEDKIIKEDIKRMLEYDPFEGYSEVDQRFLYNDLLGYLNEDNIEDSYKVSQIIQIVNNNNQIRKFNHIISQFTADANSILENQEKIKQLNQIIKDIVSNNDKIAKENGISEKSKGNKSGNRNALSYMMKDYREWGFKNAEEDYYDQLKAHGMRLVADISHKSLLEQLQLDENDYTDMVKYQKELIQELQSKVEDVEEEKRQLHEKLAKVKVGDDEDES